MKRLKMILGIVLVLLVLIVLLQNTATVETKLLFATVSMPRAALLVVTLFIGFGLGVLATGWLLRRSK